MTKDLFTELEELGRWYKTRDVVKTLRNGAAVVALLGFGGLACYNFISSVPLDPIFYDVKKANGYDVKFVNHGGWYHLVVGDYDDKRNLVDGYCLTGDDRNGDTRIDEIWAINVPSGHALENLASVDTMSSILEEILSRE